MVLGLRVGRSAKVRQEATGSTALSGGRTGMRTSRSGRDEMQELRFVAVSEDGRYAVLAVPGRSARFTLPIDERLRAVALGQTSRLVQYEIEVESPLRPKEIQARIRAGETVEEIADAAGIAAERVRWFEGPVLAERAYVADQAQKASVRRQGDAAPSTPGPQLGEIVAEQLKAFGSDPEDAQWDAKKRGDGSWQVQLAFISAGRLHIAEWVFDPRRRHVLPADDNAARMSLPGGEPPLPAAPLPGEATVTQLAPRLSTASGQAFGQSGTGTSGFGPASGPGHSGSGNGGRPRHERPQEAVSRPAEVSAPEPSAVTPPAPAPLPQLLRLRWPRKCPRPPGRCHRYGRPKRHSRPGGRKGSGDTVGISGPGRRGRREPRLRKNLGPSQWSLRLARSRRLPHQQRPRVVPSLLLRQNPGVSRHGARLARRQETSGPPSPPGTRSCSVTPASATDALLTAQSMLR